MKNNKKIIIFCIYTCIISLIVYLFTFLDFRNNVEIEVYENFKNVYIVKNYINYTSNIKTIIQTLSSGIFTGAILSLFIGIIIYNYEKEKAIISFMDFLCKYKNTFNNNFLYINFDIESFKNKKEEEFPNFEELKKELNQKFYFYKNLDIDEIKIELNAIYDKLCFFDKNIQKNIDDFYNYLYYEILDNMQYLINDSNRFINEKTKEIPLIVDNIYRIFKIQNKIYKCDCQFGYFRVFNLLRKRMDEELTYLSKITNKNNEISYIKEDIYYFEKEFGYNLK